MSPSGTQMATEMAEQPDVLRRLVTRRDEIRALLTTVAPDPLRGMVLVARGSSDNAAVYGRYVLEHALRVPVALAAPSLQTRYDVTPDLDGFVVIAVSQSGATPEIVETTRRLADGGGRTVAITNVAGSPLADAVDAAVLLDAGEEQAVPATKTFTAQVAAFALIAETLTATPPWPREAWEQAIDAVDAVLDTPAEVDGVAATLAGVDHLILVGRGFLYGTALEAGLKIAETTGLGVRGYSPADLQHGPIASATERTHVLCFCTPGPTARDVAEAASDLAERGATVVAVAPDPTCVPTVDSRIPVPAGTVEQLAGLPQVVRAQQLALATAQRRGIDPDAPFSLTKVTRTR